ncbi:MAG: ribonuclease HII [Puniceicoccaceae bacterium]
MNSVSDSYRAFDRQGYASGCTWLIGVDEAGRGPLAGPVFAAAVAMHRDACDDALFSSETWGVVKDSKQLSAARRQELHTQLMRLKGPGAHIQIGVGAASVEEIDRWNILVATRMAMYRALITVQERLPGSEPKLPRTDASLFELTGDCAGSPVEVWVDGLPLKDFPIAHRAWVKGDGRSWCIALASILAKVERDAWMLQCHRQYPWYGWDRNMGYGTSEHRDAILSRGTSPFHRRSFLKKLLNSGGSMT